MAAKRKYCQVDDIFQRETTDPRLSFGSTKNSVSGEKELRDSLNNLMTTYESLDTADDVNRKPLYSYTELIFMAVMRSPNYCLPIYQIYRFIQERYRFFQDKSTKHWRSAVRHSLSKTKCFRKIVLRRRTSYGSDNNARVRFLWCVTPEGVLSFAKGDYRPSNASPGTFALRSMFQAPGVSQIWERCIKILTSKLDDAQHQATTRSPEQVLYDLGISGVAGKSDTGRAAYPETQPKKKPRTSYKCNGTSACPSTPYSVHHSAYTDDDRCFSPYQVTHIFSEKFSSELSMNGHQLPEVPRYPKDQYPELSPLPVFYLPVVPDLPPLNVSPQEIVSQSRYSYFPCSTEPLFSPRAVWMPRN